MKKRPLLQSVPYLLMLACATSLHAALVNYTGSNAGLWSTPANWSGGLLPAIGDDVTVGNNTNSTVTGMLFNTSIGGAGFNTVAINAATASTFTVTQSGVGTGMLAQTLTLGTTTFGAIYDQSNGAATFGNLNIGSGAGGQGAYLLSGSGSLGIGTMNLGGASTTNGGNRLNQSGGTATIITTATIGTLGTSGTYNLSGGTLNINAATGLRVGLGGTGTFNHSGGTLNMGANLLNLGSFSGGSSSYTLSGSGQINSRSVNLAGRSSTLFTQTGGTHTIGSAGNGLLEIGDAGATKDAIYNLNSGTLQVNGALQVTGTQTTGGNAARLNVSGGTATTTGALTINAATALNGGATISGTGQLSANSLSLGGSGTNLLTQSAGTFSTTQSATITSLTGGSTTYTQTGGIANIGTSFTVTGAGSTAAAIQGGSLNAEQIVLGSVSGATSSMEVSGATTTVSAPVLFLGFLNGGGANNFNQSAGTVTISTGAAIGTTAANSSYNLSGTGSFNPNFLTIGTSSSGDGNGTVQQSGGTLTTSSLQLGRFAGDTGNYILSGGILTGTGGPLTLGAIVGYLGNGNFTQTGGTASLGLLTLGAVSGSTGNAALSGTGVLNTGSTNTGILGATGTFTQSGGTHTVSTQLNVAQGSSYSLSGGVLNVPAAVSGTVNTGQFNMSGGTENGGFMNNGQFSYSGGTFNGFFQNNGTVLLNASFNAGSGLRNNASITVNPSVTLAVGLAQILDNSGTITLAGGALGGPGAVVNNATINGFGTLGSGAGGFTNNALVAGAGGNLIFTSPTTINNGNLVIANGLQAQLNGGTFTNNGTLSLNSGAVTGSGGLTNAAGGNITGPGLIATPFTNNGGIEVASGTLNIAGAWTNGGVVTLSGPTASIAGGALNNPGTIQGFGNIGAGVNNLANGTIEAVGGTLRFSTLTNAAGALINAGAGAKVTATSGLATNAGIISLTGGTFDNNGNALSNSGQISGYGTLRTGSTGLVNNGTLTFAGGNSTVNGLVTNGSGRTLRVNSSTITFTGNFVNNGIVKNTGGTIIFAGTYTENGTYVSDPADNYFNDISVGGQGALIGGEGDRFFVAGDFLNASTNSQAWNTNLAELQFGGGDGSHDFSVTGVDLGSAAAGYPDNYAWGILGLAKGDTLNLMDSNGGSGALYVSTLALPGGLSQINSITGNGVNLYYDPNATGNAWLNRGTFSLTGGGAIAPIPEPSAALLIAVSAGGLTRRRRNRAD